MPTEENNPDYKGMANALDYSMDGLNAVFRAGFDHEGSAANFLGAYNFLNNPFTDIGMAAISTVASYKAAEPDLKYRAAINNFINESIRAGIEWSAEKVGATKLLELTSGVSTNVILNMHNIDFVGALSTVPQSLLGLPISEYLNLPTPDYYYVKKYQRGEAIFNEAYDSANQTLYFTTEGKVTKDFTALKLGSNGFTSNGVINEIIRTDNGNTVVIDLKKSGWKLITANGVKSGSFLEGSPDTMDAATESVITQMLQVFKSEMQLRDPNINLEPLDKVLTNIVEHENIVQVTNSEKETLSWGKSYIYNNTHQGISVFTHGNVSIVKDNDIAGNVFVMAKDAQSGLTSMVSHDAVTGLNFFHYADPANGGAITVIPVADVSQLTTAQKAVYLSVIAEANQARLEAGEELLSANPNADQNLEALFGQGDAVAEVQSLAEKTVHSQKDSLGNRDVSDEARLHDLPGAAGEKSYQNTGSTIDLIPLTDLDRVDLLMNSPDAWASTRTEQFWTLYNKALTQGAVTAGANGSSIYTLPSGVKLVVLQEVGNKAVGLLQNGNETIGVHTAFKGAYQTESLEILNADNDTNSNLVILTVADPVTGKAYDNKIELKYPENFIFSEVGGYVGNMIGQQLADGDVFKTIAYTSVLKTLGEHGGTILDLLAEGNTVQKALTVAKNGANLSDLTELQSRSDIFSGFTRNFSNALAGAIANKLVSEITEGLGIDGIGGEIVSTVGNAVTVQIIHEGFDFVFHNLDSEVFDGTFSISELFSPAHIANLLASYAGGKLASELIQPESQIAATFGSIGATYAGAIIGSASIDGVVTLSVSKAMGNILGAGLSFAPIIGTLIGTVIGQLIGTAIGNALGSEDHPASWGFLAFNKNTGQYYVTEATENDGGGKETGYNLASALANGINDILGITHGALRSTSSAASVTIGWRVGEFIVETDGDTRTFDNSGEAISYAAFKMLKDFDLVGGPAVIMRAWHNSDAHNLQEFREDIQVAEAFLEYLHNPTGILALMMDQPDSQLAQSWAVILQRAAELKLHLPNDYDFDGGWNEVLIANGIDPESLANIEETTLTVTDPVTGKDTVFHHLIGPGYEIVRIEGTDGNDIINVKVDGPSIAYVDAGSGDDIIEGSEDRDVIFGGSGDDTINGNGGDDWLNGGAGDDTINGNNGLDLIVGGEDDDILTGGAHADNIYGGKGNDVLTGGVEADKLYGGEGNDVLHGDDDNSIDQLSGGAGNDILHGYNGDIIVGGAGNDQITVDVTAAGNEGVRIGRGDGNDIITFGENVGQYTIAFDPSIALNEVWFHRDPENSSNMIVSILGENQNIKLLNYANHDIRVEVMSDYFVSLNSLNNPEYQPYLNLHPTTETNDVPLQQRAEMSRKMLGVWKTYSSISRFIHDSEMDNVILNDNVNPTKVIKYTDIPEFLYTVGTPVWNSKGYSQFMVFYDRVKEAYENDLFMRVSLSGNSGLSGRNLVGGTGDDTLIALNDPGLDHYNAFIAGGAGDDSIYGTDRYLEGYLMDILIGGEGNDQIYANQGDDRAWGGNGTDLIKGEDQEDLLYGDAGNDTIYGNNDDDEIYGGEGDDTLYGDDVPSNISQVGQDVINGGAGNDLIYGGAKDDTLDGGTGNDTIYGGTENDVLLGGEGDDHLYGEAGDDMQAGDAGNDTIYGSAGKDIIDGGSGNDTVNYSTSAGVTVNLNTRTLSGGDAAGDTITGIENITGSAFNDVLTGNAENNIIRGGSGNDTIDGAGGDDLLYGEAGTDTVTFISSGSGVTVSLAITTSQDTKGAGFDTLSGFENLTGSAFGDTLIGDAGANTLTGGDGDDTLDGGAGNDILSGGAGIDIASYKSASSAVTVSLAVTGQQVTGGAGTDTLSGMQNLVGSDYHDVLTGDSSGNVIEGGKGNDILNGGSGTDTVSYSLSEYAVSVNLATTAQQNTGLGSGLDTITAFENIIGSDHNDTLTGDANNNILEGGDGNDIIDGAAGTDTASYKSASSEVTVSLAITGQQITGGAGTDTLLNIERLIGSAHNDILTGNSGTNQIEGGAGDDIMDGGTGNDTLSYQSATASVTVSLLLTEEQDTLGAGKDTVINFEHITGSAYNDVLIGNAGSNTLKGGDGNDTLDGGAGNDTITGENGADTVSYLSAVSAVTVSLAITAAQNTGGGGTDTITTVENITGSDFNDVLTGDSGANTLKGGSGNDLLEGAGGDDKLYGDFGIDTASYAASGAAVTVNLGLTDAQNTLGAGTDTLSGIENIIGSAFDDTITGDNADNVIEAGAGDDTLIGRGGKDTLSYKSASNAITVSLAITAAQSTGGAGTDTISQFENILGSIHNDTLTGDDNDNVIEGAGGNDVLNGGAGADTVSYISAGSVVTVNLATTSAQNTGGAGSDTLSNFENITGSSFNDTLTGNGSDNVIEGGAGDDALDGAAGTDTVSYKTASAGVTVNISVTTAQNTGGAGTDTLTSFEKIIGSDYSDILTGNSSANQIEGGEGDDVLDGGSGTDTVTYINSDAGVTVNLSLTGAQSTGGAGSDTITNFENVTGSYFNDVLTGDAYANTIKGGYGNDTIEGGAGDDILSGEIGTDMLSYQSAGAGVTVSLAVATAQNTGGAGTDTIATFENVKGSAFGDILFGDAGVNLLYGGAGNDILEGGDGDDNLYGESGSDTASYTGASSAVTVNLTVTTAQNTGGAGTDLLKDIENITGSALADTLTGDASANMIEGGAGNDIMDGGAGTDTISFASSSAITFNLSTTAQQNTGAGLDTITNFENILGSAGNDILTGDVNANVIEGGAGNDVLNGAAGIDTVSYSRATGSVTVNLATTTAQNTVSAGSDTLSGFENLTGSIYADTLTGDAGDNVISGGDGNDIIQGGLGNDILSGNAGTDTLTYAAATAAVTVNLSLSLSQNTVNAGTDTLSGFENLTGSGYMDTLTGDGYNNVIDGGSGSDVIEGGNGDDTLIGGSGTDTASYSLATSSVSVSLAITEAQNTLGAGMDILTGFERLTGSIYADTLIGDGNSNVLTGGDGDDILEGGAGDDVLYGGNGYDTASYKNASAVTVSLAVTASQNTIGAGWDTLSSIQNLIGSAGNDTLTGNTSDNVIEGGLGDDILNGGNGNDTVSYSLAGSAVTINLATTQQNTGSGSGLDTLTAFENITGSAFNDTLTGDANANVIEGGAGNDILDGAAGTDTLSYKGAESGVVVSIAVSTQQDTIGAGLDTVSNFERLIGSTYNDTLTGNSGTNQIEGGAGNDIMDGGAGTDTLSYQSATAGVTVNLALTAAQNTGGAGTDTITNFESLTGSAYNDVLTGNSGSNTIRAGAGDDTIIGGAGADALYGEAGADIFGFDPSNVFATQDTISDFSLAQGDKLDISDLLSGFDPLTSAITDFVRITDNGTNSFLAVDADGGANNFIQIATLSNVIGLTDEAALKTSGNLITV